MADGAHPPTTYDGEEFVNVAMDVVFPTSPELAYSLMFTDRGFLEPFLVENQKVKGTPASARLTRTIEGG